MFGLLVTTLAVSGLASADEGLNKFKQNRDFQPENRQAMKEVLENNDYEAFQELTANKPFAKEITEKDFENMQKVHSLMKEGKIEEAKALRQELGLPGKHEKMANRRANKFMRNPEIKQAIADNDFQAFQELTADKPMAEKITQEDFGKMVQIHSLIEQGDFEAAKELRQNLECKVKCGCQN